MSTASSLGCALIQLNFEAMLQQRYIQEEVWVCTGWFETASMESIHARPRMHVEVCEEVVVQKDAIPLRQTNLRRI